MAPTPAATERGYHNLWNKAEVRPERYAQASAIARKAILNRTQYEEVMRKTGVPWYMLAAIHMRESSMDFRGVLHNGQRIIGTGQKTTIVPIGRGPFRTWPEAAVDAIRYKGLNKVTRWSIERTLFEMERYNGWGYLGKVNSPYIWSWTNLYSKGKYVADHKYVASAVDVQPGCAAIIKAIAARDRGVADRLNDREPAPPPNVIKDAAKEATSKERGTVGGAAVGGAAVGGVKVGTEVPKASGPAFVHTYVLPLVIAVCIAAVIVAAVRIKRKSDQIKLVW